MNTLGASIQKLGKCNYIVSIKNTFRGAVRTNENIWYGAFSKNTQRLKAVELFHKNLYLSSEYICDFGKEFS